MSNFIKMVPFGADVFYAEGRTDMIIKQIVAFHNFGKAPETKTTSSLNSLWLNCKMTECHIFRATYERRLTSA